MPTFEYYEFENHFFGNYYIYSTLFCQGVTFFVYSSSALAGYRKQNLLGREDVRLKIIATSEEERSRTLPHRLFLIFFKNHTSLSSHLGMCFLICLPVDVLIIYKEPFGMEATMFIIVLAFVPFLVIIK